MEALIAQIDRVLEQLDAAPTDPEAPEIARQRHVLERFRHYLSDSISEQIPQISAGFESGAIAPDPEGATDTLPGASAPLLTPEQRLERLQQLHKSADRLLVELDATLKHTFEGLQGNVRSYERSLAEGIEKLYGLGRQSEARLLATVEDLMRSLQQATQTPIDALTHNEIFDSGLTGDEVETPSVSAEEESTPSISTPPYGDRPSIPLESTPSSRDRQATESRSTPPSGDRPSTPLTPTTSSAHRQYRPIEPPPEPEPLDIWQPTDGAIADTELDWLDTEPSTPTVSPEDAAAAIEAELASSVAVVSPTAGEMEYDDWFEEYAEVVFSSPDIGEMEADDREWERTATPPETESLAEVQPPETPPEVVPKPSLPLTDEDSPPVTEKPVESEEEVLADAASVDLLERGIETLEPTPSDVDRVSSSPEETLNETAMDREPESDADEVAAQLSEMTIADANETEMEDNTASQLSALMGGESEQGSPEESTEESDSEDGNFIDIDIYEALLDPDRFTVEAEVEEPEMPSQIQPEQWESEREPEMEPEPVAGIEGESEDSEVAQALLHAEFLAEEGEEEIAIDKETIAIEDDRPEPEIEEPEEFEEPEPSQDAFEGDDFDFAEESAIEMLPATTPTDDETDPLAAFDFTHLTESNVPSSEETIAPEEPSTETLDPLEDFSFLDLDDEEDDVPDRFPTPELGSTDDSDPLAAFDFYTEEEDNNDAAIAAVFSDNIEAELSEELLPDIELEAEPAFPIDETQEAVPESGEWYLGIDIGTTGISAVLLHYSDRKIYPISWQQDSAENSIDRLPAVAYTIGETEPPSAVGFNALSLANLDAEVPGASPGVLFKNLKTFLELALPWEDEEGTQQPILQYSERQEIPLVQWRRSLQSLLATLTPNSMEPQVETFDNTTIPPLAGVIASIPAESSAAYQFNLREAVLQAKLVSKADRVFLVEDSVAAILSTLPSSDGEPLIFGDDDRAREFQFDRWQGTILVVNSGAANTELCIARVTDRLQDFDRDRILTYRFRYGGNDLDRDIIFQLLLDEDFARELPLSLPGGIELPKPGEPNGQSRVLFDRWLQTSPLRRSLLDIAKHVKIALQTENEFAFPFGDRRLTVKRQDLERRVLLPFAQKLNRELNVFLSQTGVAVEAIDRTLCTGGTTSWPAISRWLRQKLPNATIVCDVYPHAPDRDRSRIAYGLAMFPLYPGVLDTHSHQYHDLFLLRELLQAFPDNTASSKEIIAALDRRGINIKACKSIIAKLLKGKQATGLIPDATEAVFFTEMSLQHPAIAAIADAPLFHIENKHTYRLDPQQRQQWLQQIDRVLASCHQTLTEPLVAAIDPVSTSSS